MISQKKALEVQTNAALQKTSRLWGVIERHEAAEYVYDRIGALRTHTLRSPALVQAVLRDPETFIRPVFINKILERNIGKGLLADSGESWAKARSVLAPMFTPKATQTSFSPRVLHEAGQLCTAWRNVSAPIDVEQALRCATGRAIVKTIFGDAIQDIEIDSLVEAYVTLLDPKEPVLIGLSKIIGLPFNPIGRMSEKERSANALVTNRLSFLIDARRKALTQGAAEEKTLLDRLLLVKDNLGEAVFTEQEILAQINTLIAAGHETTSVALVFAFQALLDHPDMAKKIRQEVNHIAPDQNLKPEHYESLPYTQNFFKEVLRLYPPVFALFREVTKNVEIGGISFRKGALVRVAIERVQKSGLHWGHADIFDPERFSGDQTGLKQKFLPFGSGPRNCIGRAFAMAEGVLMLAKLVQAFDLEVVQPMKGIKHSLTARPDGALLIRPVSQPSPVLEAQGF